MPLKLACLSTDWGRALHAVALARGINSTLIDSRHTPTPASVLFCRPPQRDPSQAVAMALAHIAAGGKCVQSREDLRCYENRMHQMDILEDFYPRGEVVPTMEWAAEAVHNLGLPIVSKANFGSGSATVRLLATREEALDDAREVIQNGRQFGRWPTQYGVALWQEFLPHNDYAVRVTQITDRLGWAFKVMNRAHDWRASGSGMCVPMTQAELVAHRGAIGMHLEVAARMGSRWLGTDMLYDHKRAQWRCVDVTLAWTHKSALIGGHWDATVIDLHTLARHQAAHTHLGVDSMRDMHGSEQWAILLDDLCRQYR